MCSSAKISVGLLLLILSSAAAHAFDESQIELDKQSNGTLLLNGSSSRRREASGSRGIQTTTKVPEDEIVHRPKSVSLTSSSVSSSPSTRPSYGKSVGLASPKGAGKSTFRSIDSAFVGHKDQRMNGPGLVLVNNDRMPKSARFFGQQMVQSEFY